MHHETLRFLSDRIPYPPSLLLILGSGMGAMAEEMEDGVRIPYVEIPGFPRSTVEGHAGEGERAVGPRRDRTAERHARGLGLALRDRVQRPRRVHQRVGDALPVAADHPAAHRRQAGERQPDGRDVVAGVPRGLGERALSSLAEGGWLVPGAVAVLEERADAAIALPPGFAEIDRRSYGDTQILIAIRRPG